MNVHLEPPPATDTDTSDAYPEDGEPAALEIEDAAAAWYCMLEPGTSDAVDGEPAALEVEDGGRKKQVSCDVLVFWVATIFCNKFAR